MKTLAAILLEQNAPLALEEIEIPKISTGQVLVQVICSGICGSQLGEISGVKGPDRFLPHLLGHEGTGTVLECGEGVKTVKPGDRVVMHWRKGAGMESVPLTYASKIGAVNAGWVTTFNQHAVVSENRVTVIPADFDPGIAALFGCAVTTGFGVVSNDAKLKIGQSIAIFGAGGIGLNIVQAAAMVSGDPIIAIDVFQNRLALAKTLGATHCIDSSKRNAAEEILRIVGKTGVDVAVDNTGNVKVIEEAYRVTGDRGTTVLVGVPLKDSQAAFHTLPLHFDKRIVGSYGGDSRPDLDIPRYLRLCQSGKLELGTLIGKRYKLAQINEAILDMRSGRIAGRCLIEM